MATPIGLIACWSGLLYRKSCELTYAYSFDMWIQIYLCTPENSHVQLNSLFKVCVHPLPSAKGGGLERESQGNFCKYNMMMG